MIVLSIVFLIVFTSGVISFSYEGFANQKGWPIGKLFVNNGTGYLSIIGFLSAISIFITSFFFIKWYIVLLGAIIGWFLSAILTFIFKTYVQYLVLILYILSIVIYLFIRH